MNQGYPPSSDYPPENPPEMAQPRRVLVQPPQGQPFVTYAILVIVILVYLSQMAAPYLFSGRDLPTLWGMKINELIVQGQFWRLITPVFLHGSVWHIAFNMYALLVFGPGLERFYGHGRFLALFFISGFAGNVMSFLFSSAPSLGSSTAIFGLLAGEAVFLYSNRNLFGAGAQGALINLLIVALANLFIGGISPGIDNWGHIGGLVGGALFAWFAGPVMQIAGYAPNYSLVDERGSGDAWRAGIGVTALFVLLAAAGIYFRV